MAEPTESSPLLAAEPWPDASNGDIGVSSSEAIDPIPARDHFKRPIRILTILIRFTAIIDIVLVIATLVILANGPFISHAFSWSQGLNAIGVFV